MPTIDDGATAYCDGSGRDPRRLRAARPWAFSPRACHVGAIIVAVLFGLAACSLIKDEAPETAGGANPPIAVEPVPGPVALAPSMTGSPPPPPPAQPVAPAAPERSAAAAPPAPQPEPAQPAAPPPAPAAAIPAAAPAPTLCPPGSIGMWSEPDVVGTAVYICHRLNPQR